MSKLNNISKIAMLGHVGVGNTQLQRAIDLASTKHARRGIIITSPEQLSNVINHDKILKNSIVVIDDSSSIETALINILGQTYKERE